MEKSIDKGLHLLLKFDESCYGEFFEKIIARGSLDLVKSFLESFPRNSAVKFAEDIFTKDNKEGNTITSINVKSFKIWEGGTSRDFELEDIPF